MSGGAYISFMDVIDVEWRELPLVADAGFTTTVVNAVSWPIEPDSAFMPTVPVLGFTAAVENTTRSPRKPAHWLLKLLRWPIAPRRFSWPWERPVLLSNPPTQAGKTSALQRQISRGQSGTLLLEYGPKWLAQKP